MHRFVIVLHPLPASRRAAKRLGLPLLLVCLTATSGCALGGSHGGSCAAGGGGDADKDGLSDVQEAELGTDPCSIDTDGDQYTDLIEVAAGTDPRDPNSRVREGDFSLVLPFEGACEARSLRFDTKIKRADVYFLIDTTGSMANAIQNVRDNFSSRIVPEIAASIPNVQMGVGTFQDFPMHGMGQDGDMPYVKVQPITDNVPAVQGALNGVGLANGGDGPESQAEAAFQAITGQGGSWTGAGKTVTVSPGSCDGERFGSACFRDNSVAIVALVSDAPWGAPAAGAGDRYSGLSPQPASFRMAAEAINRVRGRFIGVGVTDLNGKVNGQHEMLEMERQTGTVDSSGRPLQFFGDPGSMADQIVEAIARIADSVPQDVGTRNDNLAGNPDDFDATAFIRSVRPGQAYDRSGVASAGYASKDDSRFVALIPGHTAEFAVDFCNTDRPPSRVAEVFRATITVVGSGNQDLDVRQVYVVVPPNGGSVTTLI